MKSNSLYSILLTFKLCILLMLTFVLHPMHTALSSNNDKLNEILKVLEYSTELEGDIDPDDKIKLTTRIIDHVNNETYYLTPVLEKINGKFSYSHKLNQNNSTHQYQIKAKANAQVENDNNLSIHVQNFNTDNETVNRELYRKYARHLKKYVDYIYSQNIDLDPSKLQDLKNAYIYYGSIANGQSPAVEAGFQIENQKHKDQIAKNFSTMGGTNGIKENSISYGITNLPGTGEAHSIENVVATANGNETISGIKIDTLEDPQYKENATMGQAITQAGPDVSVTIVDANGKVSGDGYTQNASYSEDENGILATVGEVINKTNNDYPKPPRNLPKAPLLTPITSNYASDPSANDLLTKKDYSSNPISDHPTNLDSSGITILC